MIDDIILREGVLPSSLGDQFTMAKRTSLESLSRGIASFIARLASRPPLKAIMILLPIDG